MDDLTEGEEMFGQMLIDAAASVGAVIPEDMRKSFTSMAALLLSAYDPSNETSLAVVSAHGSILACHRVNTNEQGAAQMINIINDALHSKPDTARLQ